MPQKKFYLSARFVPNLQKTPAKNKQFAGVQYFMSLILVEDSFKQFF